MTGSAKFVVCGFWLVHNTPPRKIVQTARGENRTVPRGATISITTVKLHRVTAQTVLAIAAIARRYNANMQIVMLCGGGVFDF